MWDEAAWLTLGAIVCLGGDREAWGLTRRCRRSQTGPMDCSHTANIPTNFLMAATHLRTFESRYSTPCY